MEARMTPDTPAESLARAEAASLIRDYYAAFNTAFGLDLS